MDLYDYYGYYGRGFGAGQAVWMILALLLAIIGGFVVYFVFLPDKKERRYRGFAAWLYDFLNFKKMTIEAVLKITYSISAIFITLFSFGLIPTSFWLFLLVLIFGNLICRLSYELIMIRISIWRNTRDINKKLGSTDPDDDISMVSDFTIPETRSNQNPYSQPYYAHQKPYRASEQAYTPPQQTYEAPKTSYTAPQQTYTPPKPAYEPPKPAYTAPASFVPAQTAQSPVTAYQAPEPEVPVQEAPFTQAAPEPEIPAQEAAPAEVFEEPKVRVCQNCGAEVSLEARFCRNCGKPLS